MVICKHCDKPNTLDGLFCRACGHALDEQELQTAKTANQALLADGFKLLAEQRYTEALMVADKVLETDPSAAQGYSLRGDGLERAGDLVGALAAYERVAELQPESTLDRIKLTHLRNVIAERTQVAPAPNKRMALLASVAAFALVASLGSAFALWINSRNVETRVIPSTGGLQASALNPNRNPVDPVVTDTRRPAPKPETPSEARPPEPTQAAPVSRPEPAREGSLPEARPNGMSGEVRPMNPGNIQITPIPDAGATQPTPQPTRPANADPEPSAQTQPAPAGATDPPKANPSAPRPVIDIRPSPSNPRPVGNSQTVPESGPRTASDWIRVGREAFIQENYAEAERAYARALQLGADPGLYNQRRGQCLERLGRKAEAIQAYEAAAAAYDRRVKAGNASESDRAGLEASRRSADALR